MTLLLRRKALLALAMLAAAAAAAATVLPDLQRQRPDLAQIRRATCDPASPYYYPRLMDEYLRNDTLMKIDKYRHLYLGYMFQEDYSPYRSADHPLQVSAAPAATRADLDAIVAYAREALDDNPFDLRQMTLMIKALRDQGKTNLAAIWQYKLNYLLMAIVSTGTGLDKDNAWTVIEPQHEYVLMNMMDYRVDDHSYLDPGIEYLAVSDPSGRKAGGFYFNIQPMLEQYYRKHPEEAQ